MSQDSGVPDSFLDFCLTCSAISSTTSKLKKVEILSTYLKRLGKEALPVVCRYLSGRVFERGSKSQVAMGYSTLTSLILEVSGQTPEELKKAYLAFGDLGKAAEVLLQNRAFTPLFEEKLSMPDIQKSLQKVASVSGHGAVKEKAKIIKGLLIHLSPIESKYFLKVLTGELRIGLQEGLVEEAVSKAFGRDFEQVRRSLLITGDIGFTALLASEGRMDEVEILPMQPSHYMLADTMLSGKEISDYYCKEVYAEFKYDGIRTQAHKRGQQVRLFSRRLDDISESFPEIADSLSNSRHDFVLDGEIVPFKENRPLSFQALQHRLQRKEVTMEFVRETPTSLFAYDLLFLDGRSLTNLGLKERRAHLESMDLPGVMVSRISAVRTEEDIERLFEESKNSGYEGLVVKDPSSPYLPGKRGKHWIKLKKELDTIDAVVVAAEYGHGKRAGVLSDYTFAVRDGDILKVVGKAYSGLTDQEIEIMTRKMKELTIEDQGFRRLVKPEVVLEVAFDAIQKSNRHDGGFALRFPRIKRIRFDKSVSDISSIHDVGSIYMGQRRELAQ